MEVQDFTETSAALWLIISDFYKNLHGANFVNPLSLGVACHSAAVEKNLARSGSGRQSSQGFTFTVISASAVRGDAVVTVPEWLGH